MMAPEGWEGKGGKWTRGRKQSGVGCGVGVLVREGPESFGRAHRERLLGYLTLLCRKRVILSGG